MPVFEGMEGCGLKSEYDCNSFKEGMHSLGSAKSVCFISHLSLALCNMNTCGRTDNVLYAFATE